MLNNSTVGIANDQETPQIFWSKLSLSLIPATTILGNVLVIMSVLKFKSLQTAINFLIFGLAFADLFVAVFVMPYAVYIEIFGGMWHLGDLMCNIYSACDVACSTASILILAVISFDRYRAVSKPITYSRQTQNIAQVFYMLGAIWFVSITLASPIVLGANTRPAKESPYECRFYNAHFLIFSSIISFVIPCFVVLFVYLRIIQELRKKEMAAKMRHLSTTNQISVQSSCGTPCGSTLSLDDVSRMNTETDEVALCSSTYGPRSDSTRSSFRRMLNFFRQITSKDGFFRRVQAICANFETARRGIKRYRAVNGGDSVLTTLANNNHNDDDFELSPSTVGSETPSHSFSNCSTFDASNTISSCPCTQALLYGMSVHRLGDDNDDGSLATMIVPHSQFYRFCRALTKKAISKQFDSDVTQDSNGNTVSSAQSDSADEHCRNKPDPFLQVAPPMVTFNIMVHELNLKNNSSPKKASLDDRSAEDEKPCIQRSKSYCTIQSCSGESVSEFKNNTELSCELSPKVSSKRSDTASLSTIFKTRILRRTASNNRKNNNAKRKISKMQRRERRATKTLGIVVGVFLLCWVPFFTMNILNAVCIILKVEACEVNFNVFFYCTWLGYMNSFMNPIIYTVFNAEFRRAFKTILHLEDLRKLSASFS